MSRDLLRVRTIRPHDTAQGVRSPGDEYERTAADARAMEASDIVAIVGTVADAPRPRSKASKAKPAVTDPST